MMTTNYTTKRKPRKTAAERRAEEQAQLKTAQDAAVAKLTAEWPDRLMRNLQAATDFGWPIRVIDGKFQIDTSYIDTLYSGYTSEMLAFGLVPVGGVMGWNATLPTGDFWAMDKLEELISDALHARQEAARKAQIRQSALAKLNHEEKMELGLA